MSPRRPALPLLAAPLTLLLLAGGVAGCSGGGGSEIKVGTVARSTVTEVVEAPANVVAKASATMNAPADGRVHNLLVSDGQQVRAGQVLLRIDSPSAEQQLRQAEKADAEAASSGQVDIPGLDFTSSQRQADQAARRAFASARAAAAQIPDVTLRKQAYARVAQAEAAYAAARADARVNVRRFNAGLSSLADAFSSLSQAQRLQTKAAVTAAQRTVDALVVRAPISGTLALRSGTGGTGGTGGDLSSLVGQLPADAQSQASQLLGGNAGASEGTGEGSAPGAGGVIAAGTPVSAGAPLVTITDDSALSLTASVDETDVLLVSRGVKADVELDAVPGASYAATVTSVNPSPTTSSRGGVSYQVRLTLGGGSTAEGDPAPRPKPGMSAVADLKVRTAVDAVSVPASAIVRDGNRDTVWAVENDRARRRQVKLGAQGENEVQVLQGVQVGERVVVRGADRVRESQKVSS